MKHIVWMGLGVWLAGAAHADSVSLANDPRVQSLLFVPDQVITVRGWVGYHVDLTFEEGESILTIAGGDLEGLTVAGIANHLVLKPKAAGIRTNLTVFTSRRTYRIDYRARGRAPDPLSDELVYAIRMLYPSSTAVTPAAMLEAAPAAKTRNEDYWYCGAPELRPIEVFDDGSHTYLTFAPQAEMPALFVADEAGHESLLNFNVKDGQVQVHRLARRLVLRRGALTGCIVNQGFSGVGERLNSGTVSPAVTRERKEVR